MTSSKHLSNPNTSRRIGIRSLIGLVSILVILVGVMYWRQLITSPSDMISLPEELKEIAGRAGDPTLTHGLQVYSEKCAPCHGTTGLGDGPAAYLLYPKPRDFSSGQFRLTSTQSGLPSDADLMRTLTRGMPGSSMPPWGHLSESTISGLVAAVRTLALEGRAKSLMANGEMPIEEAYKIANNVMTPGPPVEIPPRPQRIDTALGQDLYTSGCAPCHDADGRGQLKRDLKDSDGYPALARDFTQGIFKGGSESDILALRITRGLPGSPMPGLPYDSLELWSIVDYLKDFISPGAQERAEQSRQVLTPTTLDSLVPRDPLNDKWERSERVFLPVTPLWWRDDRIEGIRVSILHNNTEVGFRLEWDDSTENIDQLLQDNFSDGVALQFSNAEDPPSLTMGSVQGECDIWYWRASTDPVVAASTESLKDVHTYFEPSKELSEKIAQDPAYLTAAAVGNPLSVRGNNSRAQDLQARGFGTLTARGPDDQTVEGSAKRTSAGWAVVFVRSLQPTHLNDVTFEKGRSIHVGFAVWDGQHQDRNGQKSVTIWHALKW